ncbi:hypothetical protein O181_023426 [Austropuccinia psidii MF-1]|uniref:Uncharacterized protein n=1 Tax=Austropuccinia psidii MF-1 TaxID=1389203 RepID=A0A9Q3CJD1_9BASI|nr:hypothetical protein [Austropuccinia psidii MF-1]
MKDVDMKKLINTTKASNVFNEYIKGFIQNMEKYLPNSTDTNENNHKIKVSSSADEKEDIFIDALEQKPQTIRVLGARRPTLISSKINRENILPFSQR